MEPKVYPPAVDQILICADGFQDGVLSGRLLYPGCAPERFSCLSQCLLRIENQLDKYSLLESYTVARTFQDVHLADCLPNADSDLPQGSVATFHLRILYRRNSSWQGKVMWLEKGLCQSFRSALELMTLVVSALEKE